MTAADLELWLLEEQLGRIEQRSRSMLRKFGFPTSLDVLATIDWNRLPTTASSLHQRAERDSRNGTAIVNWALLPTVTRSLQRAYLRCFRAMMALNYVNQVRAFVAEGNASRAAYAAMQAGVFSGDLLADAERGARVYAGTREGGRKTARTQRLEQVQRDRTWLAMTRAIRNADPDLSNSEIAAQIASRVGKSPETVRKRLRQLESAH